MIGNYFKGINKNKINLKEIMLKKIGILLTIGFFIILFFILNKSSNVSNDNIHHFVEKIPLEYMDQLMIINKLPSKFTTNDYSMDITEKSMEYKEHWINKNHRIYINIYITKDPQIWEYEYNHSDLIIESITVKDSKGIYTRNEGPLINSNNMIVTEDINFTKDNIHYSIGQSYMIHKKDRVNQSTFIEFVDSHLHRYNDL